MKAVLVTIGDEILLGQILDTNSRYMARELARRGIETVRMFSVPDEAAAITAALDRAFACGDCVLVTGGLGPTKDDITKKTLAQYFGTELVFHEQAYEWVAELVGENMNEYNRTQALLPKNALILHNRKGTASGMWFEKEGKILVSLPGVPFEMEYLMQAEVLPRMEKRLGEDLVRYQMLTVFGVPEAALAMSLQNFENSLPEGLGLAYLPSPGFVRLRLTAKGLQAGEKLAEYFAHLQAALAGKHVEISHGENAEEELVRRVAALGVTVACAESCTGGKIASMLTAVPGASAYFLGGVVAYANEVKTQVLGVRGEDLAQYGAVSETVARQMAEGVRRITGAQWAVSTTGVAGPDGGTAQKPVGTVWIGVAGPQGSMAREFHFSPTRERNIGKAAVTALEMLLSSVKGTP